jgi:hypothetical protein
MITRIVLQVDPQVISAEFQSMTISGLQSMIKTRNICYTSHYHVATAQISADSSLKQNKFTISRIVF